jgi:hypothetical protein
MKAEGASHEGGNPACACLVLLCNEFASKIRRCEVEARREGFRCPRLVTAVTIVRVR